MSFFKKLFGKEEVSKPSKAKKESINSFADFWNWFLKNEKKFHDVVKKGKYIEVDFFDQMTPKLNELREGIYCLSGMLDDTTADLILSPDGNIKNFYFIEELIDSSPDIDGWKFRAHKPEIFTDVPAIKMGKYKFDSDNISFYSNDSKIYPDEINISLIHDDFNENNKSDIINGCYILLDNYLGELKFTTLIDNIDFIEKSNATQELVSLNKLKDFLIWREKEFIEKYDGKRRNTENDSYSSLEATLKNGNPLIATINSDLLEWDSKASHPWILNVEIKYDGENNNGMPNNETYEFLNKIEEDILNDLKDYEGYLNIGRQTADNAREIYFACKEFREPCKVLDQIIDKYSKSIVVEYDIYKDKYWRSLENFRA